MRPDVIELGHSESCFQFLPFFSGVDPLLPQDALQAWGGVTRRILFYVNAKKKSSVAMTTVSWVDFSRALKKCVWKREPEKLFKEWCIIYLYFSPASELLEGVTCVRRVLNLSQRSSNALMLPVRLFFMRLIHLTYTLLWSKSLSPTWKEIPFMNEITLSASCYCTLLYLYHRGIKKFS